MLEDPFEYEPKPGSRFWGWTLAAWLFVIGLFSAGVVTCAHSAEVFRSQDDKGGAAILKLHAEPCGNEKVLAHITTPFRPLFKRATLFYWGQEWASCWLDHDGIVISVDEMGAQFQPVPRRLFKDESV